MQLAISTQSTEPIYAQLRDQVVRGIASGQIQLGEGLPSVRRLAAELGVNLHTVRKGYETLCAEGYVVIDRRRGAIIAQSFPDDGGFLVRMAQDLSLLAAEARCHTMGEDAFLSLCRASFVEAGGSR